MEHKIEGIKLIDLLILTDNDNYIVINYDGRILKGSVSDLMETLKTEILSKEVTYINQSNTSLLFKICESEE